MSELIVKSQFGHTVILKKASKEIAEKVRDLCIVLMINGANLIHIGLLVKDIGESDDVFFIHQPWHEGSLNDTIDAMLHISRNKVALIECMPGILEDERITLCMQIHSLVNNNPNGIPYSINYRPYECYFDDQRELKTLNPGDGLTCATFILEIFKQLNYTLIDASTWHFRPTDAAWKNFILQNLNEHPKVTPEHIKNQMAESGARFRPEETAAAAAIYKKGRLEKFATIEPIGTCIERGLRSLLG